MKIRKPRLGIGKKGVKISNIGVRLGGKRAGLNISRKGVSASGKVGRASYNTRKGCSLPFFLVILIAGLILLEVAWPKTIKNP